MSEPVKRYEVWIGDKFYGAFEKVVLAADFARLEQECRRLSDESHRNRVDLVDATERSDRLKAERDAALNQIQRLVEAGNPLSNTAYNLAQHEGRPLSKYECELMSELRKRWDAALSAKP